MTGERTGKEGPVSEGWQDYICGNCGHARGSHGEEQPYPCCWDDDCDCPSFEYRNIQLKRAAPVPEGGERQGHLSVLDWAKERLANSERLADEKVGADREGWLEDVHYWKQIVAALSRSSMETGREQLLKRITSDLIYRMLTAELDHPSGYITKDPLTLDSVTIDGVIGCESMAEFLRVALGKE